MSSSAAAAATAAAAAASPAAATIAEAQARLEGLRQRERQQDDAAEALRAAIEALPPGLVKDDKRRDLDARERALTATRAAIREEEVRIDTARGVGGLADTAAIDKALVRQQQREAHARRATKMQMGRATFGILEEGSDDAFVGVAFAITKRHLLTAHHNLVTSGGILRSVRIKSPTLEPPAPTTSASSSAGGAASPVYLATRVGNERVRGGLDWTVLRVNDPVLEPVGLWRGTFSFADAGEHITLFDVGVGPVTEAADLLPKIYVVGGSIVAIHADVFHYNAPTFPGDSGGPIIYNAYGEVCGMHIQQINKVPGDRPAATAAAPTAAGPKSAPEKRGSKRPRGPAATTAAASASASAGPKSAPEKRKAKRTRDDGAEELRSSLSGSTAHLGEALRIDVILPALLRLCAGEL